MSSSIVNLQTRYRELGRLRMGERVPFGNGKRPSKLDVWRFTSTDWRLIARAAELYGGKPERWDDAPSGTRQFQVTSEADAIPVILPPDVAISQALEAWTAAGCVRRCDGQVEYVSGAECLCAQEDDGPCKPTTRLSVLLPDMPGLGVWRLETRGWFAARELVPMVRLASTLGRGQTYRLRIDPRAQISRQDDGKPVTYHFGVPVLDTDLTPSQLLELEGGNGGTVALQQSEGTAARGVAQIAVPSGHQSDPPSVSIPPTPEAGSDPMSGGEGERVRSGNTPRERRHDPSSSDPSSSTSVRGRQSSGTSTSEAQLPADAHGGTEGQSTSRSHAAAAPSDQTSEGEKVGGVSPSTRTTAGSVDSPSDPMSPPEASPRGANGGDHQSGEGSRTHTAGMPGDGTAVSPSPDDLSESPAPPQDTTPGGVGEATNEDEQLAIIANRDGPEAERELAAGQTQSVKAVVTELEAEERRPVFYWCQRNNVDIRQAKVALRKQFRTDFGDVKDWRDLQELQGDRAVKAITYLEAIFTQEQT